MIGRALDSTKYCKAEVTRVLELRRHRRVGCFTKKRLDAVYCCIVYVQWLNATKKQQDRRSLLPPMSRYDVCPAA